jgi:hypothetical protein
VRSQQVLESTLTQYYNLARRPWGVFLPDLDISSHLKTHIGLLQEIVDGNATEAQRLVHAHVDAFESAVFRSESDRLLRRGRRPANQSRTHPSSR